MRSKALRREAGTRPTRGIPRSLPLLAVATVPLALGCAGASLPVFLPGEPVECLFEVMGDLTVEGPFRVDRDAAGGSREALQGVRIEVGRQAFESGADAVMVRELVYERDAVAAGDDAPEIVAVEGMLLSFVDPTCVPAS